jgi:hypothetical protein
MHASSAKLCIDSATIGAARRVSVPGSRARTQADLNVFEFEGLERKHWRLSDELALIAEV